MPHLSPPPSPRRPPARWVWLSLLALSLSAPLPALAQGPAGAPRAALLRTSEADGVPAGLGESLDRLLRAQLGEIEGVRLHGSSGLSVSDVQLALGCVGETPACLEVVARELEVEVLVMPRLDRTGEELLLSLTRFSLGQADPLRTLVHRVPAVAGEVALMEASPTLLRGLFEVAGAGGGGSEEGPAPSPEPPLHDGGGEEVSPAALTLLGLGLAVGGVAVGVGVFAEDQARAYREAPIATRLEVDAALVLRGSAESSATAALAVGIAGGAALAIGLTWTLLSLSSGSAPGDLALAPWATPRSAGLSLSAPLPEVL